ncbi:NUDIX hydrolase [Streptomyces eurythermus]|uniref:NUDIX hydrolase n=1 Tax=Streptomyces eurythermus TaxID=42237 RepID=UPI001E39A913|nr:NUDIX domain-containing protein [Streptomyces eurythermus]
MPGGKPEPDETTEQALVRESREELGVTPNASTVIPLLIVQAPADGKPTETLVRTVCCTAEHTGTPVPHAEIAEIACLTHGDAPRTSATTSEVLDRLATTGAAPWPTVSASGAKNGSPATGQVRDQRGRHTEVGPGHGLAPARTHRQRREYAPRQHRHVD